MAQPVTYHGRRVRALRIGDPAGVALLQAISRSEFATAGFRNRDLRALLQPATPTDTRRLPARITRQLRLLRARGLFTKAPKTQRCQLTKRGYLLTAALSAVREAWLQKLVGSAAA